MDSTNFQPDHHHHQQQQQQHYLLLHHQQQQQQPPYPYADAYSPLLDVDHQHHLSSYAVGGSISTPPEHQHSSNLLPQNQGRYGSCVNQEEEEEEEVVRCNSEYKNDDVMGSPNFLSNFLGIVNQNPSDADQLQLGSHQWNIPQQLRSINSSNTSFSSLLSSNAQLGFTSSSSSSASSCLLGLNLQPSDLFNCSGIRSYADHHPHLALTPFGPKMASGALSWPTRSRALDSTKVSSGLMNNGVAGIKRPAGGSWSDTSPKSSSGNKKSTLKNPCPPFKVRKEKLGDRIAALHQLVSPFGKTDTASVLTEAIGYIQFLQDQIHTLCMPNVKPLRNKPCNRAMHPISSEDHEQELKEAQDLRKRGMCLVPLSWSSFITTDQMDPSLSLPAHHYY